MKLKKPIMLMILDGYGYNESQYGNAVKQANTPVMDMIWNKYPHILANASGKAVGLPAGQMGNSEVGHTNIGAGRVVYQSLSLVNNEIKEKRFKKNKILLEAINKAKKNNSKIHLLGLLSDGGVHSMNTHLYELLDMVKEHGVDDKTFIHIITDGRDVAPKTSVKYIEELISKLESNKATIATICGRYYTLDRDQRWERVQKSYDAMVNRTSPSFNDPIKYINDSYNKDLTDEFVEPAFNEDVPNGKIDSKDSVIFYNFRPDRAREISHMLIGSSSYEYKLSGEKLKNIYLATMRPYLGIKSNIIYPNAQLKNTIGEVLYNEKLTQIRTAETEKYPHVTFFLDGGIAEFDYKTETKILIPSPKVATYDMKPEMSAYELTDALLEKIEGIDATIINFANPDMVGHTGDLKAVINSVEAVDECMGKIYKKFVEELGGTIMIVADHGNADEMLYEDGSSMTKHTTNPVPVVITDETIKFKKEFTDFSNVKAKLADFVPTLLKIADVKIPKEMTGNILVE